MTSIFRHRLCGVVFGCVAAVLGTSVLHASDQGHKLGVDQASDEDFSVLVQGIGQDRLFAIDFEGSMGIAVGGAGMIKISQDGGATWVSEQAPTTLALLGVSLAKRRAIAVGQQGLVLLRDEQGVWREVQSVTRERLLDVDMNAQGLAVAVGAFGTVIASRDGGQSWSNAAPDWIEIAKVAGRQNDRTGAVNEPTVFAVQTFEDGSVLLGGELSYILRSTNAASSWSLAYRAPVLHDVVAPTVHAIEVRPDGVGFAVGQEGHVFKTTDRGASWVVRPTPSGNGNLLAVSSTGTGMVFAVGMRIAVRSDNDGDSWSVVHGGDFTVNWYSDIASSTQARQLIGAGHSGRIIAIN